MYLTVLFSDPNKGCFFTLFQMKFSIASNYYYLLFDCILFVCKDGELIQHALSFYRLMVVWLVGLVGGFKMPLPSTCPMEFACMPEHFVEDAMELLIFASRIPKALDGVMLVSCRLYFDSICSLLSQDPCVMWSFCLAG